MRTCVEDVAAAAAAAVVIRCGTRKALSPNITFMCMIGKHVRVFRAPTCAIYNIDTHSVCVYRIVCVGAMYGWRACLARALGSAILFKCVYL